VSASLLVAALADPTVLLLLAAALLLAWRRWRGRDARLGPRALAVLLLLWAVLHTPAVGRLLMGTLEGPYPPTPGRPDGAEAIVVLGGYVYRPAGEGMPAELGTDSLLRCVRAADLYRQGPRCPVVVSGGAVEPDGPAVAQVMRDFLIAHGVAEADVVVEDRSQSTRENAAETARVLRSRGLGRVALVTDAAHLRRALACFRAEGIDALPCGCRYRAAPRALTVRDFVPDPAVAAGQRYVAHEWLGIGWYKLRGSI
jgi:uncharacterized SAM-binding protein YcdF (DUF218 family)